MWPSQGQDAGSIPVSRSMKKDKKQKEEKFVLVIDAGTTNAKVFLIDKKLNIIDKSVIRLKKSFPKTGWVEQNPEEIFNAAVAQLQKIIKKHKSKNIIGIGITNQRETTICWDKTTGKAVYPAIVWQDNRTLKLCSALENKISNKIIKNKTGLTFLPYFSASKLNWILENVPKAKKLAGQNNLAFGTVDSWLIFKLSGGKNHATDFTNASRTLLFNLQTLKWDRELLSLFKIPQTILPEVKNSFSIFGFLSKGVAGLRLPISAVMGDQQSSLYMAGKKFGTTKITYGTGAFILQNLGKKFISDKNLFTTLAVGVGGKPVYALEGKVSPCGDLVTPVLEDEKELKKVLTTIAVKVHKLLTRFPKNYDKIMVDGGVSRSDYLISKQEKLAGVKIERPKSFEGTALGTAKLIFDNLK